MKQIPLSAKRRKARMDEGYKAHREGETAEGYSRLEGWDAHFWSLGWWKREYEVNP